MLAAIYQMLPELMFVVPWSHPAGE